MTLIWIRGTEYRVVADLPTTAPEGGPRLHLRELRDRADEINAFHYSLDPHRALAPAPTRSEDR